jgi:serine phosphatase RsbU (regulator of sigma subunit)
MEVWGGNRSVDSGVVMAGLDARIYSQPSDGSEDGGDVHYVSSCALGMIARMLIADVSGHGQPVAQVAGRLRKLMQRHASHHNQVRLMRSLNQEFAVLSGGEGRFATAVAFTFDALKNRLLVSNAGHPPSLVYRKKKAEWNYLSAGDEHAESAGGFDVPFGIEDESEYGQSEVKLDVGDMIVAYTDSLPEARCGDGEMLGAAGLLELCRALPEPDLDGFVPGLLGAIRRHCGRDTFDDDVTILAFRPNGIRRRVPLTNRLAAPFRWIWSVADSYLGTSHA